LRDCQRHSDEVACAVGDPALSTLRREGAIDDAETPALGARERARRDASEEGREQEHADGVLRRDGDGVSRRRRMELGCEERSAQGLEPVTERSMAALAALRSHEPCPLRTRSASLGSSRKRRNARARPDETRHAQHDGNHAAALMQLTVPFAIAAQGLLQPPQLFTSGATVG
jgi:hypothetical protein